MTNEKQRIAIAKACGSHSVTVERIDEGIEIIITDKNGLMQWTRMMDDGPVSISTPFEWIRMPDYDSDLNALADARNQLINTRELRIKWVTNLRKVVGRGCEHNKAGAPLVSDIDLLFATVPELAEALLKTLGLWGDGE